MIAHRILTISTVPARLLRVLVEASPHLGTDGYAVTNFECLDFGSGERHVANDFVARNAGVGNGTPASLDGMDVSAADARVGDFDLHVFGTERSGLELPGRDFAIGIIGGIGVHSSWSGSHRAGLRLTVVGR
ncbi:unnamed protein product [Phytophthora fragariaefolia]|uniref:Unnamed protein product n=1 Tax=Phytophthora fragariaefolia TaxID=1490495 RepID=A0A9W7D1G9_9STRA|nr:unnamed protein product [Phytophthora fragariaefolia]